MKEEGVEIVRRSASEGGLSIWTKENDETLPSIEDAGCVDEGQEATLVEERDTSSPSKTMFGSIYKSLRRKKVKRTSIILPPQISAQLNLALKNDEQRQEANQKADYARRLLEAAFRPHDAGWEKEDPDEFKGMKRIDMIETAFKYAVEARRLTGTTPNQDDMLDDERAQGEAAALEAHHFILACKSKALLPNLDMGEEDDGSINGGLYTPQDIQDAADKNQKRAYFHMENILSTFEKKIKAPEHIILNSSPRRNGEDATLSTLGFDNTFQESPTSKEKYSITSLNELMDGPQSMGASKALVQAANAKDETEPEPVSPLSGTVESQLKPEVEQVAANPEEEEVQQEKAPRKSDKTKIKVGALLLSSLQKRKEKAKNEKIDKVTVAADDEGSDDASSEVSAMSELASIRALEQDINSKLKQAAAHGDGDFSLVGDDAKMEAPKFVKAPSLDLSIMSLEKWDNLAEGSSLDDIVRRAEAEKEKRIREEQGMPTEDDVVEQKPPPTKSMWPSRLWRSRSENFAQVKPPAHAVERGPSALEAEKARLVGGKKPDVIPPPFVIVSNEDRVQSTLDDIAPKYQVQSMNILGLDAAPANDDAVSNAKKGMKWKRMLPRKKQEDSSKGLLATGKKCLSTKKAKDINSEAGVYHDETKGVTTSTDTDVLSWAENGLHLKSLDTKEMFVGDKYRTLAEDVDSAIEQAERQERSKDPLDSGIDMLLNNANPDIVRKVLSADAGKAEGDGKPVDFADVEYENEDAVRTQTALMSRDAVLENIYADRTPPKTPKPLERSSTHANVEPSSSFLDMIDKEKEKLVTPIKPRRISSFFHRKSRKGSTAQVA